MAPGVAIKVLNIYLLYWDVLYIPYTRKCFYENGIRFISHYLLGLIDKLAQNSIKYTERKWALFPSKSEYEVNVFFIVCYWGINYGENGQDRVDKKIGLNWALGRKRSLGPTLEKYSLVRYIFFYYIYRHAPLHYN